MATIDEDGIPQVRIINVMHIEDEKLYFLTARGKPFYHELLRDKKVAVLGLSHFEMIRLNGVPELLPKGKQNEWLAKLFEENPYMKKTYPGETRQILEVFCIKDGAIEYFNLGVHPIFRESYVIGNCIAKGNVYMITEDCTGCGICTKICPQGCITAGAPYHIMQENCLQCGSCIEKCPVSAVEFRKHKSI
jgi:uncharacterized pyridoxamine 5'-phosphate oxidase family protein/Pyruvate/2-oxoacid:ferredoxin oxidoreductase delta subunit